MSSPLIGRTDRHEAAQFRLSVKPMDRNLGGAGTCACRVRTHADPCKSVKGTSARANLWNQSLGAFFNFSRGLLKNPNGFADLSPYADDPR